MGLPSARDLTLGPSYPIPSALLNKLQDCVVDNKQPSCTDWVWPGAPNSLGSGNSMSGTVIALGTAGLFTGLSLGPIREGRRITAFAIWLLGAAVGKTVSFNLVAGVTGHLLGTLAITTTASGFAVYTQTLATPYVITPGDALYLNQSALANQAGMEVGSIGITNDNL